MVPSISQERWPSGLRRTLGKRVGVNASPGFESPSLRHLFTIYINQLVSKLADFFVPRVNIWELPNTDKYACVKPE